MKAFIQKHRVLFLTLSGVLVLALVTSALLLIFLPPKQSDPTPPASSGPQNPSSPQTDPEGDPENPPSVDKDFPVLESLDTEPLPSSEIVSVTEKDGISYQLYQDYAEVTECDPAKSSVTLPAEVDGVPLMSIAPHAFRDCSKLTSLSLPESLRFIGSFAFEGCDSLTALDLPESLNRIEEYAFLGCTALKDVTIHGGVKFIGAYAFDDTPYLTENKDEWMLVGDNIILAYHGEGGRLAIPECVKMVASLSANPYITGLHFLEGTTELGAYSLQGLSSLAEIVLPSSLRIIGEGAFSGCDFLTEIALPDGLEILSDNVFSYCMNLKTVSFPESLYVIGDNLFETTDTIEELRVIYGSIAETHFASGEYAELLKIEEV